MVVTTCIFALTGLAIGGWTYQRSNQPEESHGSFMQLSRFNTQQAAVIRIPWDLGLPSFYAA